LNLGKSDILTGFIASNQENPLYHCLYYIYRLGSVFAWFIAQI